MDVVHIAAEHWQLLVLMAVLLCCSAFMSGSETALFALTRADVAAFRSSGHRLQRLAARLAARPRPLLTTVLLGNMIVNVLFFASSYSLLVDLHRTVSPMAATAAGIVALLLVIVLGEVAPKGLAYTVPRWAAPLAAPVLALLQWVSSPVRWVLENLLVEPITRLLMPYARQREPFITPHELQQLLHSSERGGLISGRQRNLLREVARLSQVKVRDIMVHRTDVVAYEVHGPTEGLLAMFRTSRLRKVPVYDGTIDRVTGVVYAKHAYLDPSQPVAKLVRPVHYVMELQTAESVLVHFRQTRSQFAVVVDEYGGTAGVVTLEDVLERIVGEIGEGDEPEASAATDLEQVGPHEFVVAGDLSLLDWADFLPGAAVSRRQVHTVAGLVSSLLGRMPAVGDMVELGNLSLKVEEMSGRRVTRVRIRWHGREEMVSAEGPGPGGPGSDEGGARTGEKGGKGEP